LLFLRTIVSWFAYIPLTVFFGSIGLVLAVTFPNVVSKYVVRPWAKLLLFSTGVRVVVKGFENIPRVPCVIMYNHQSIFDVFTYMSIMPVDWRAMMKKEAGRIPFVGWVAVLSGHYTVSRDGSSSDTKEVKKIVSKIKKGPTVVIAPEGTRSLDGKLLPFQKGGFLIAMLAKVPVVTMVIQGGLERRSKTSRMVNPGTMHVTIFPPIDVNEMPRGREGREELMRLVRSQMEEVLSKKEGYVSA